MNVPLLSIPPQPTCARCGKSHHAIPMTLEDYAIVEADRLARVVDALILDEILSARR